MEDQELAFNCNALLAENHQMNGRITAHLLRRHGIRAACAAGGIQAEAMFRASDAYFYDIIFTDIAMPEGSGPDAARAIRALKRPDARTVPIIALADSVSEQEKQEYRQMGIDDILLTPFSPEQLDAVLQKWVPMAAKKVPQPADAAPAEDAALPELHTLDIKQVLHLTGGDVLLSRDALKAYARVLPEKIEALKQSLVKRNYKAYALELHNLCTAIDTVGVPELAQQAEKLEQAGKEGNAIAILKGNQRFLNRLVEQAQELAQAFPLMKEDIEEKAKEDSPLEMASEHLAQELQTLFGLLKEEKYVEADALLDELRKWKHPSEEVELLHGLNVNLRTASYHTAMETIRKDFYRRQALARGRTAEEPKENA
jgi:CheY-like chemotaxis protein